ncbi:hypothetical protein CC78DRAFT_622016 [Lojkania enalia]|uniref:CENP-V/GFA domain-containing protein n=1 Tax=Lojkania enalia TaxID=147567 RepID=A0A9P4JYK0_9PLEO|nr:hypothetical protein CC78DRAFT_622016 [Didymosphaeria enalia]
MSITTPGDLPSKPSVYHGSCHCGTIRYSIKLTFPIVKSNDRLAKLVRVYKCNCTTCHKMAMFHCRVANPATDFILTSPSAIEEMGEYRTAEKVIGWYFCKNCGVRVFGVGGGWVQREIDGGEWGEAADEGVRKTVWATEEGPLIKRVFDGKEIEMPLHYVSVNAVTLEGVDLREWHEKGWMFYVDRRFDSKPGFRWEGPYENIVIALQD